MLQKPLTYYWPFMIGKSMIFLLIIALFTPSSLVAQDTKKQEFHSLIDRFEQAFESEVGDHGKKLIIKRYWDSPKVNAYAYRKPGIYGIKVYGGLYRFANLQRDGFSLILCHELGHHLAGPPIKKNDWSSFEGQADYWSTHKCLKKLWRYEEAQINTNSKIESLCQSRQDTHLCERIIQASLHVSTLFGKDLPSLFKKDPTKVKYSYPYHLKSQCRLDTFISGALCDKNYCESEEGAKPRCWFNPNNN